MCNNSSTGNRSAAWVAQTQMHSCLLVYISYMYVCMAQKHNLACNRYVCMCVYMHISISLLNIYTYIYININCNSRRFHRHIVAAVLICIYIHVHTCTYVYSYAYIYFYSLHFLLSYWLPACCSIQLLGQPSFFQTAIKASAGRHLCEEIYGCCSDFNLRVRAHCAHKNMNRPAYTYVNIYVCVYLITVFAIKG